MSETSQPKTNAAEKDAHKCKKRDRSASEERLLAAGIEIFSKYGFNGATTKMIAKKADVNESLIGRYFDGKEGLLLSIVERFIIELRTEELPYPPQPSLVEELQCYTECKTCHSDNRESIVKIIISQALTDSKFRKKALERIPMFEDPGLLARLKDLIEKGELPATANIQQICAEVQTYLHGAYLFDLILSEMPREKVSERARNFIVNYARGIKNS